MIIRRYSDSHHGYQWPGYWSHRANRASQGDVVVKALAYELDSGRCWCTMEVERRGYEWIGPEDPDNAALQKESNWRRAA